MTEAASQQTRLMFRSLAVEKVERAASSGKIPRAAGVPFVRLSARCDRCLAHYCSII